ncbi:MAG: hypothetical protein QMC67_11615 [Candidatus Wallbacteria bacterium]
MNISTNLTRIYKINENLNIETNMKNGKSKINTQPENPQPKIRPSFENGKLRIDILV